MVTIETIFKETFRDLNKFYMAEKESRPESKITDGYRIMRRVNQVGTAFLFDVYCTNLQYKALSHIKRAQLDENEEIRDSIWFVKTKTKD
jgi:hypothetical protein